MAKQWSIKSGPSKYDWQESLFHRKYPAAEVEMTIQETKGAETEVRTIRIRLISQIPLQSEAENRRDPQSWGFYGTMGRGVDSSQHYRGRDIEVIGRYSTSTREGTITEDDSDEIYEKLRRIGLL